MNLIQVMKALSDETRIRILNILKDGDMCVCEIEAVLNISQSNASRHLTKLTNAEVIVYYKINKYVYYKINEAAVNEFPFIDEIIKMHTCKLEQCIKDMENLKEHRKSGLGCDDLTSTC